MITRKRNPTSVTLKSCMFFVHFIIKKFEYQIHQTILEFFEKREFFNQNIISQNNMYTNQTTFKVKKGTQVVPKIKKTKSLESGLSNAVSTI